MPDKTDAFLHSQTKENLMRAFAGESQARNRYTITAGIAPDQAMLETVTDTVSQTLTDNLEAVTQAISAGLGDQAQLTQKAGAVLASPDFTPAEKQAFQETGPQTPASSRPSSSPCRRGCWRPSSPR